MKTLAYWKGRVRDAEVAVKYNRTLEFCRALKFAKDKVKQIESATFK